MAYNPLSIVAEYFPFDAFTFTYNLNSAVVAADVGKAVTLDTSGANKMKLTGAADVVMGRLYSFEDRTQQGGGKAGAVERKLRAKLAYTGTAPALGDQIEGSATAGVVQATAVQPAVGARLNRVIEVDTVNGYVVVELF